MATIGAVFALGLYGPAPAVARHWYGSSGEATAAASPAFEWIVLDAETGRVLGEQNADTVTYPASLTKMMTLYLTFEQLNLGHITLDQRFNVSAYAASRAPSRLGLEPGETVSVRDLILGVVTKSANDAATVLAEGLAGSEANFARYMDWKARQLGMDHTWYQNASGLPDPEQRTNARDIARLALALYQRFPREYRYFATREFDFRGQVVRGHDHLLEWYQGADGIKTGFINASGFNLASSAVRNGHRLIGVIMGGRSARSRDMQMASLLDQGFAILAAGQPVPPQATTLVATAAPPFPAPPTAPTFPSVPGAAAPSVPPAATATAPAARPAPAASPAVAAALARPAPASSPAVAAAPSHAAATSETAAALSKDERPGFLRKVATAAMSHLAPVGKAEAAPLVRAAHESGDDWAIQLGAFRAQTAAAHAAREAAQLAVVRGKPQQVIAPARAERPAFYRARLLHFTQRGAQAACVELRHRGIACSVVHAGSVHVANG